jgi:predicted GNAT family N-acyltransferase
VLSGHAWRFPRWPNEEHIMDWKCCEFGQLSSDELYLLLRARNAVLVVENAHVHLDIDGKDKQALHVFAIDTRAQQRSVEGYARLLPGDDIDPETIIDKFLTSAARRDDDTAEQLLRRALSHARERWPGAPVRIHSPIYREAFYSRFGFRKVDGPFLEHGMPYIGMIHSMRDTTLPSRGLLRGVRGLVEPVAGAMGSVTQPARAVRADARTESDAYAFSSRLHADSGVNR